MLFYEASERLFNLHSSQISKTSVDVATFSVAPHAVSARYSERIHKNGDGFIASYGNVPPKLLRYV